MKTKLLISLIALFCSSLVWANEENSEKKGILMGQVYEKDTSETLPYVDVIIRKNGNIIVESITDEEGNFVVEKIPFGEYLLELSFIGFETSVQKIKVDRKKINLGKLYLESDTVGMIESVTKVGKKTTIINKIDRKVLDLGDDIIADGADLDDVMNTVPGVFVDQQSNAIQLRGNTNVRILINGKPTTLSYEQVKQQYPPDAIDKIEVITNPSAKYSPEGNSGIINFIVKKQKMKGTNISLSSNFRYGDIGKYATHLNFNHNIGKINFFGNTGYGDYRVMQDGQFNMPKQNRFQAVDIDVRTRTLNKYGKLGFDWFINDYNTISAFANFAGNDNEYGSYEELRNLNKVLLSNNTVDSEGNNSWKEYNINYERKFNKDDHKVEIEASYNNYNNAADRDTSDSNIGLYTENNDLESSQFLIDVDYANPIGEKIKLGLGTAIRLTEYEEAYLHSQATGIHIYTFDRDIYATYAELSHELGRFGYKAGLRAEHVEVKTGYNDASFQEYDRDYFEWYPTVHLTYKLGEEEKTQLSANYSRRVDRPSTGILTPIPQYASSNLQVIGNPSLRPQFTNSFELGISRQLKKGYVGLTGFYRKVNDEFTTQQSTYGEDGIIKLQYLNVGSTDNYGAELTFNYNPTKWWSIYSGAEYYFAELEGSVYFDPVTGVDEMAQVDNNSFFLRMNNSFKLNETLSMSLFGFYKSKQNTLQGDFNEMWKIDVGAKKTFMDNKLSLSIRFQDIFDIMHAEWSNIRPERYQQFGEWNWENQQIFVGVKYNFKSGKAKNRSRKDRSDNEVDGGGFGM